MKLIIIITLTLGINAFAHANSSAQRLNTTLPSTTFERIKKNFDLEFLIAAEQTKDIYTKKIDGSYTKFDTSLLQKVTKNDELRYFLSTRYLDTPQINDENQFDIFFFELMYRRKNILTQKTHGLNLEAELKYYEVMNDDIKDNYGYHGTFIPQLIAKRNFGRTASVKMKVRRHFYQTINDESYTPEFEDRLYLSASYMLSRRFMFNTQLKYQHKVRKSSGWNYRYGNHFDKFIKVSGYDPIKREPILDFSDIPEAKKHQEIVTLHPGVMYFINRQSMVEFYVETKLSDTYDKRDLETIMNDEFVFGTALYLTVF